MLTQTNIQAAFNAVAGIVGAVVAYAFGQWSELMSFFLFTMALDYITGVAASIKNGTGLNSNIGFWGLGKKGLMLLVVMLAHRMDLMMGTAVVMTGAIYFYLSNELVSITENYGRLGLPLPGWVKQIIAVLKNRGEAPEQGRPGS